MSELIKRQDAINAVAQLYKYESDRMTALQEVPAVTEQEIRNKAIDEMVDGIRDILECNAIYNIDCIVTLANRMKDGE